jgi:protein O-mannosyl-transferase
LILFLVLCQLFEYQNLLLPFISTLLFATHPIHTEVVNNIKSMDEVLCFLFGIISIGLLLKYSKTHSKQLYICGGVCFLLCLVSKETGIAFLLIIPLTIYFFSDYFKKSIFKISFLLASLTILWLVIRYLIFKDLVRNTVTETSALNNTLYAAPDLLSKYATAFYILFKYVGLLLFPHPLTCDYNFAQIKIQTFADAGALLGILIYIGMGVYAMINLPKKKLSSYAILFYLITLAPVSNIFFLGGSSMAERFIYTPSLGFCLIISYGLLKISKTDMVKTDDYSVLNFLKKNSAVFLVFLTIFLLYSVKTYSRSQDWKNTLTVYSHDIHVSGNSATANELLGNYLILQVAPSANKKNQLDTFNIAKKYLKRALEIAPGFFYASSNLGYIYLVENKPDSAYYFTSRGIRYGPQDIRLNYYLGSSLLLLKNFDESIKVLNKTVLLSPQYEDAYKMLANAYMSKGDVNNGLATFYKLLQINPNNGQVCYTVGEILKQKGDVEKANEFLNKAKALGYHR